MKKLEAIKILENEGWTKVDAIRALEKVDFNEDTDELMVRRAISLFAGSELLKRQRLQSAQKGIVTKKSKEIESKDKKNSELETKANDLVSQRVELITEKNQLEQVNNQLKRENRHMKNLIDQIKLKIAIDMKKLIQYEDSEIRQALVKWFSGNQG